jgi:hypothetical protein
MKQAKEISERANPMWGSLSCASTEGWRAEWKRILPLLFQILLRFPGRFCRLLIKAESSGHC